MGLLRRVALARYGEIALKSPPVRRRMERKLLENVVRALERRGIEFEEAAIESARILVYTERSEEAARAMARVFGVVSTSPAVECGNSIEEIQRVALEEARRFIERRRVETFAVRARRSFKGYPLTSKDVERIVGNVVRRELGLSVDLEGPDLVVGIEVWRDRAFVYTETIRGPGGLPYGVEGLALALFSGGIDSFVAAWLAAKRGCRVCLLFADPGSFWSDAARERVARAARELREWVPESLRLFIVENYGELLKQILERVERELVCIVCKKLMMRIGEALAREIGALALVTGESIGQVASQTLHNIAAVESGVRIPVIRPVAGMDKEEIAELARRIGVYTSLAIDVGRCRAAPLHPATRADMNRVEGYSDLVEELASRASVVERSVD